MAVALGGITFSAALILAGDPAKASEIVYTPINPTFGGNALNSSQLQYVATAQKPNAPTTKSATTQQSTAYQFLQMLQSQLYASLANSVSNAITGQNAQATGTIKLDTMQVSWSTQTDGKHVSITDSSTGQITEIVIPVISATR
jgi:curli production assembly/transport component CsgF